MLEFENFGLNNSNISKNDTRVQRIDSDLNNMLGKDKENQKSSNICTIRISAKDLNNDRKHRP